ncbi:MAG: divergent PAP2 family protein [Candidatus Omnitrophica bacterium]|nr:divergent PAP2 family protein [Candidatus Omnitrophota bacterium]
MFLYDPPFPEIRAFIAVVFSWILAQTIKVTREVIRKKRFNLKWLLDTGGMPSAHSAGVVAVATAVGLFYGFTSIIFLIAFSFAVVTMFDAAGVRRAVGRQAVVLNKMTNELYERGQIGETRVKELLGHTPVEVFAGAFLGIIITLLICR